MLLAQQSASLLEAQTVNIREALKEHEAHQDAKFQKLDSKIRAVGVQDGRTGSEAATGGRPQALEEKGAGEQRRLVFGGWADNTRRTVILHQLGESLSHLSIKHLFDSEPFTTGPRRAVALCHFSARPGERSWHCKVGNAACGPPSAVHLRNGDEQAWPGASRRWSHIIGLVIWGTLILTTGPVRPGWERRNSPATRRHGLSVEHFRYHDRDRGGRGWIDEVGLAKASQGVQADGRG